MADRKGSVSSSKTLTNAASAAPTSGDVPPAASATSSAAAMTNVRSASPYGTRSRNRGARINYAEDKDNEMDYEFTPPYTSVATTSSTKTNGTLEAPTSGTTGTTRRQSAAGASGKAEIKDGNDAAAAASSALMVPTNNAAGKKRKGAGSQVMVQNMSKDSTLSNMLSFDSPYLEDGKLIAEDGTVLRVHGTYNFNSAAAGG